MGLATKSGLTSRQQNLNIYVFTSILFTIPSFLHGLSNAMTISLAFVADTFNGFKLVKTIIKWDSVLVDWISCLIFFLIPVFTAGVSLAVSSETWWKNATIAVSTQISFVFKPDTTTNFNIYKFSLISNHFEFESPANYL